MVSDYKIGGYTINELYSPNSMEPPAHYLGQQGLISAGQMGITINPAVADQLGELSRALNAGTIPVEVGTLDFKLFETIPKEHWEEMRRKAKLAGSKLSLHAPLVDPAGFGERGWNETQQELSKRQLQMVVDQAAILAKGTKEAIPITIHPSNYQGTIWNKTKDGKEISQMVVVDKESGQLKPIEPEVRYQLGGGDKENPSQLGSLKTKKSAEKMLQIANHTQWEKELDKVLYEKESASKTLNEVFPYIKERYFQRYYLGNKPSKEDPNEEKLLERVEIAKAHLEDARLSLNNSFEKAYKYADNEEKRKKLKEISESFRRELGYWTKEEERKMNKEEKMKLLKKQADLENQAKVIQKTAEVLRMEDFNPNMLQRVEEFAAEKAAETFSDMALHSYDIAKKNKIANPIISIENLYQGIAFSQSDDLKKIVDGARKNFTKKLIKERNLSESEAKKRAEEIIGITFDVGHLNMSKKQGFEDKDLIKEAEALKQYVKHVHLTDNFGYNDVHLPIGMGNVPVKELLTALGDNGKKARKINEVGGWLNAFKTSPYKQLLEAAGSPIYSSGTGPYWSGVGGFQQSYLEGYGQMLPQTNYEVFGAGFSNLPKALGGQRGQGGGRMGGGF